MKSYKIKTQEFYWLDRVTCDACNKEIDVIDGDIKKSRIVPIKYEAGYGSILEDGLRYEVELCETCFLKLFSAIWHKEVY